MSLSENMRKLRKKAGFTQIELSEKLGVSIATLRRWEFGETAPSGIRITELAKILEIPPEEFISERRRDVLTKSFVMDNGMLIFEKGDVRIELPSTEKGYELFNKIVEKLM